MNRLWPFAVLVGLALMSWHAGGYQPAPGQTVNKAEVGPYTIELQSLEPYPQTPEDPIAFEDYRATSVVRR